MASTATSQVMARLALDDRAKYEALAALNDITLSELMRQSLELAEPQLRLSGEEAAKKRANLPHGVTQRAEDEALESLVVRLNAGELVSFKLRDALSPMSKALYRFLSLIWQVDTGENSKKFLDKLAIRVNEILEKEPQREITENPREIKSRPRKGS